MRAMRHAALANGKRMRPFYVIETGALFDADQKALLRTAAALASRRDAASVLASSKCIARNLKAKAGTVGEAKRSREHIKSRLDLVGGCVISRAPIDDHPRLDYSASADEPAPPTLILPFGTSTLGSTSEGAPPCAEEMALADVTAEAAEAGRRTRMGAGMDSMGEQSTARIDSTEAAVDCSGDPFVNSCSAAQEIERVGVIGGLPPHPLAQRPGRTRVRMALQRGSGRDLQPRPARKVDWWSETLSRDLEILRGVRSQAYSLSV